MNPEAKKIWIEALRSGKYRQGRHYLRFRLTHTTNVYCCLGVLVDCYLKDAKDECYWELSIDNASAYYVHGMVQQWQTGSLPEEKRFQKWAGQMSSDAQLKLISMNDEQKLDFGQIADWIEQNL